MIAKIASAINFLVVCCKSKKSTNHAKYGTFPITEKGLRNSPTEQNIDFCVPQFTYHVELKKNLSGR